MPSVRLLTTYVRKTNVTWKQKNSTLWLYRLQECSRTWRDRPLGGYGSYTAVGETMTPINRTQVIRFETQATWHIRDKGAAISPGWIFVSPWVYIQIFITVCKILRLWIEGSWKWGKLVIIVSYVGQTKIVGDKRRPHEPHAVHFPMNPNNFTTLQRSYNPGPAPK